MRLARAAAMVALSACAIVHQRAEDSVQARPAGDEGMLLYTVGRLSFEAPAGWSARGDARRLQLVSPREDGRIDAQVADRTFRTDAECLADAEANLAQGAARFSNVRRHPTTFAGRKALVQEADQQGWHGWAWAVCDGGEQYRVFFTGRSPLDPEGVRTARLIPSSATLSTLSTRPGA